MLSFFKKKKTIPHIKLSGVIGNTGKFKQGIDFSGQEEIITKAFSVKKAPCVAITINSPGGSPVQSHLIYSFIRREAKKNKKKVIVFAEDVAASGGYLIACAGDEIYANSSSIIGSIGVIYSSFGFTELIKKIGVERRVHTAGKNKSTLDPFLEEKKEDIERLKNIQLDKIGRFPDIDCKIRAEIKDITPITTFLDSIDLNINTNIAMSLYSDENVSSLNIDSISIREFRFEKGDLEIESDPLFLDGRLLMSIQDSVPYFEDFSLNIENGQSIKINDNLITETNANLHYDGDNINFKFQSVLNNTFGMSSSMNAQLHGEKIRLTIDSTQFAYKDFYKKINWDD